MPIGIEIRGYDDGVTLPHLSYSTGNLPAFFCSPITSAPLDTAFASSLCHLLWLVLTK